MTKLESLSTASLNTSGRVTTTLDTIDNGIENITLTKRHFIGETVSQRLAQVQTSQFPLYRLAKPLLNVLSELPSKIDPLTPVETLRSWLIYEVTLFSQLCEQVNIPWRKMTIVRYCLCTAMDEAIHTTEWGIKSGWSQQNLLNYFEEDNDGGNKFFLLAGRLAMNPTEYADVLRVMLHCLNLGFEGRYSIQQEGKQQLTQIRQQLYRLLEPYLEPPTTLFTDSPRLAQPTQLRQRLSRRGASLLSLLFVMGLYTAYRLPLDYRLSQLTNTALRLSDHQQWQPIQQAALTLPQLLKTDIEQGKLTVERLTQGDLVKVVDSAMFASGSAKLLAQHHALIARLAQAVKTLDGKVTLIGHSDSQPIKSQKNTSNQQLSLQRAEEVAQIFYHHGFTDSQLQPVGAGERQPLTANLNAAQRNQNRRVEFFITY